MKIVDLKIKLFLPNATRASCSARLASRWLLAILGMDGAKGQVGQAPSGCLKPWSGNERHWLALDLQVVASHTKIMKAIHGSHVGTRASTSASPRATEITAGNPHQ